MDKIETINVKRTMRCSYILFSVVIMALIVFGFTWDRIFDAVEEVDVLIERGEEMANPGVRGDGVREDDSRDGGGVSLEEVEVEVMIMLEKLEEELRKIDRPCIDVLEPVMGADGVVYDNACVAKRAGVEIEGN
jgi:signal recognition particle subunit SEC65